MRSIQSLLLRHRRTRKPERPVNPRRQPVTPEQLYHAYDMGFNTRAISPPTSFRERMVVEWQRGTREAGAMKSKMLAAAKERLSVK